MPTGKTIRRNPQRPPLPPNDPDMRSFKDPSLAEYCQKKVATRHPGANSEAIIPFECDSVPLERPALPLPDLSGEKAPSYEGGTIPDDASSDDKISQLSRLFYALCSISRATLHTKDFNLLLEEICQIAATYVPFCLVWVGVPEPSRGFLKALAATGRSKHYLDLIRVSISEKEIEGKGPTGMAARHKRPYICNDFLASPHTAPWHEAARACGIASSAVFPLRRHGKVTGALKVYSAQRGFFDNDAVALLIAIADTVSAILDRTAWGADRNEASGQRHGCEEQMKLILEGTCEAFWDWEVEGGQFRVSDHFLEILGLTKKDIDQEVTAIRALIHPADRQVVRETLTRHLDGMTRAYEVEFRMGTKTGDWIWFLERGKVVSRSVTGNPLRVVGTWIDITLRKQLESDLLFMSTHDSMTGLFNRAYFDAELKKSAVSRRYPVSVVIADVDGLKKINDRFGHSAGDNVIRQTAKALREAFRAEDVIARIGGDEFAVILPDTDDAAVNDAVQRVKDFQAKMNQQNPEFRMSLSIGSATARNNAELNDAVNLADSRMYYCKLNRKFDHYRKIG